MRTANRGVDRCLVRWLLGGWVVWVGLACTPEAPVRPSLVLVTVDRLATDRLGCFGGPPEAASSLCALAAHGSRFAWATTPSLGEASAAASVLTGLRPEAHGLGDGGIDFLADRHRTIAESLAGAGYATGAFIASPRLNRSRRLDQGFERYEDRLLQRIPGDPGSLSIDPASVIQDWIEQAGSPFFLWIHLRSGPSLADLDRLIDRLARVLERDEDGPGILLVALAGEPSPPTSMDGAYHVPLLWRPPAQATTPARAPAISFRLASLLDVEPTLRVAAGLPRIAATPGSASAVGRDLSALALEPGVETGTSAVPEPFEARNPTERFLLLKTRRAAATDREEVGLASEHYLYIRRESPMDGSGRPVPAPELRSLEARYARIEPRADASPQAGPRADPQAALALPLWHRDVLRGESPVPGLEFHLARLLADPEAGDSSP